MAVPTNPSLHARAALAPSPVSQAAAEVLVEVWRQGQCKQERYCSAATMTHRHGDIPERRWPTVTIMPVR